MRRLLFIQYRPFGAVMNGGDQGTKKNLDMLCHVLGKENVTVFYLHEKQGGSTIYEYIKAFFYIPFGYFMGLTPAKVKKIVKQAEEYDYVFIDRSLFGVVAKALKRAGYKGRIITSFQNIEVLYMETKMPKHLPFRNVLILCGDRAELMQRYNRDAEITIPVVLEDRLNGAQTDNKSMTQKHPLCLLMGAYFLANTEGIVWFMKNVYPHVDIEVRIVGKGMGKLKEEQPELLAGIEVLSDVPDLAPYFEEADIMILPIFAGSGMKVKTCESLMYGKNILATDEALEGYAIEQGVSAWRCNNAEEFIAAIQEFVQHPRPRFNQAARQCFLDNYSTQAVEKKFKELLS